MTRDPYTVLGVSSSATPAQIKSAYLHLAHIHHPDKGGDAEKFKEISAAYAQVKDGRAAPAYTPQHTQTQSEHDPYHWRNKAKTTHSANNMYGFSYSDINNMTTKDFNDLMERILRRKFEGN